MRLTAPIVVALLIVGCSGPTDPGPDLAPALISGFNDDDPRITLALTGSTLTVEIHSYGNACRSKGEVRVSVDNGARSVEFSPFDWEQRDRICADILLTFEHLTTVDLSEAGDWEVAVIGEGIGPGIANSEPVRFTYTVQVET